MAADKSDKPLNVRDQQDVERAQEAQRALDNAAQAEGFMRSSLAGNAKRATRKLTGDQASDEDQIEKWAKRTGRALGALFAIFLIVYLFTTYVMQ